MSKEKESRTEDEAPLRVHDLARDSGAAREEESKDAVTSQSHDPRASQTQIGGGEDGATNKTTIWTILDYWKPQRCRYDPKNPPQFTLATNILLGFVSAYLPHIHMCIVMTNKRKGWNIYCGKPLLSTAHPKPHRRRVQREL